MKVAYYCSIQDSMTDHIHFERNVDMQLLRLQHEEFGRKNKEMFKLDKGRWIY